MTISSMPSGSVARMCAGQVVTDLSSCCKELIENALDSGATCVKVKLTEGGADEIEVEDNGAGVKVTDREKLCEKVR